MGPNVGFNVGSSLGLKVLTLSGLLVGICIGSRDLTIKFDSLDGDIVGETDEVNAAII